MEEAEKAVTKSRGSIRIDESLKVGFRPDGKAWAEAPAGEKSFSARARARAETTKSPNVAEFCRRWAAQWDAQSTK